MTDNEKNEILSEHEMNPDEMKTVSGGVVIDWPAKCKATVESGSSCWGTDACSEANVLYFRDAAVYGCSSTVESQSPCWSSDYCSITQIRYDYCVGTIKRKP